MKKYFKLKLIVLLLTFSVNTYADVPFPDDPDAGGDPNTGGPGTRATPIDSNMSILIITAVTIAGAYSYKQRKLFQK